MSRTSVERAELPGGGRLFWLVEVPAALLLTIERVLFSVALLLLGIASYAWWGNPASPLGVLWRVSAVLGVLWVVSFALHIALLKKVKRHHRRAGWAYMDTIDEIDTRELERALREEHAERTDA